jgi:serine/threonine protein kinase/tetratricopeptide (TPR) repeat protein
MTPERWQQVKNLLAVVLDVDPSERAAHLDKLCTGDSSLRSEIESLLAVSHETDPDLLNSTAVAGAAEESSGANARIGGWIGAYQIVEEIGVGGMGEVYRAFRADDQYRKEVAIKLVRAGQDSSFVISRFKNERQVLASLDHPNIAHLLDGGTTKDGVPYFVMELIEGQPIDQYCDNHKLPTTARLSLFLKVCSAVQYAHQRLIIHRDLKPSNILVTADGTPKLLDFGIAKMLDPAAVSGTPELTMSMFRMLTPGYASPEQMKGEEITTASDVYSLGVLLYELLTGHRPYQTAGRAPHEISQAVCEFQPARPSTAVRRIETRETTGGLVEISPASLSAVRDGSTEKLSKRLRGDLDNIVLMALRKEPSRRYASVDQFATDMRWHLGNLPVSASKDTIRYRASKFVTRHKVGVAATAVVVLTLLAGMAVTAHEARVARAERAKAERRFNDVRKLANSLLFEIHDAIKDLPGSTQARGLLVKRALEYLDSLSQESRGDSALQRELASAYERVGDVQGQALQANLGDKAGAMASYKKALSIRESLANANPADLDLRRELVQNCGKLSDLSWNLGDSDAAMENSRKALATSEELYAADGKNQLYRRLLALALLDYGYKQAMVEGNDAAGAENVKKSTQLLEEMVAENPQNLRLRRTLGLSYSRAGEITSSDPQQSVQTLAYYRKALAVQTAVSEADPNNAELRRLAAYDQYAVGQALASTGNYSEALQNERAALGVFEDLSQRDASNMELREDIGYVHGDIGRALLLSGNQTDAIKQLREAMGALAAIGEAQNQKSRVASVITLDQYWLGKAYTSAAFSTKIPSIKRSDCNEAQSYFRESLRGLDVTRPRAASSSGTEPTAADIEHEVARCGAVSQTGKPASH